MSDLRNPSTALCDAGGCAVCPEEPSPQRHRDTDTTSRKALRAKRLLMANCQLLIAGSIRVHLHHFLDRSAADGAKGLVTREHDAIHLWTVVSLRLVIRSLERPDLACIFLRSEHRVLFFAFFAE